MAHTRAMRWKPSGGTASTLACGLCSPHDVSRETLFLLKQKLGHSRPHPHTPAMFRILKVSPITFSSPQWYLGRVWKGAVPGPWGGSSGRASAHTCLPGVGWEWGGRMGQAVTERLHGTLCIHKNPVPRRVTNARRWRCAWLGSGHPRKNGAWWSHRGSLFAERPRLGNSTVNEMGKETMHESKSLGCSADDLRAGLARLRWVCEPCLGR